MPKYSGKKCTYGTANKIGRHKNGVDTVGRLRVKRENRSLITQLDALHAYIYDKNSDDDSHIGVLTGIKREPRCKYQTTTDVIQSFDSQTCT